MHLRTFTHFLALGLCCLTAGCGLGDYESRMDAERARIKLYDEENHYLGVLAEPPPPLPPAKEGEPERPVWPFPVLLRLPAGVAGQPMERPYAGLQSPPVPLYRYPGPEVGLNVFIAAGLAVEKNKENRYQPGEWTMDDFRSNIRSAIREYYKKEYNFVPRLFIKADDPAMRDRRQPPKTQRGEELPELVFDKYVETDADNTKITEHSEFQLYFYRLQNRQIAIVFQLLDRARNEETNKAIDWSLKSLDISDQAADRRPAMAAAINRRQGRK